MIKRSLVVALLAATALAGPARAEVPVYDVAVARNVSKSVDAIHDQTALVDEMKEVNKDIFNSLGSFGPLSDLSQLPQWKKFDEGGSFAQALRAYKPNTCALVACEAEDGGQAAPLTDLPAARNWVRRSFYAGVPVDAVQQADLVELRARAEREAAGAAYALSLLSRDQMASAADRGVALEDLVQRSEDLRSDVRANSAVALAQYQQMTHMLALMTAMVELQSAQMLRTDRDFVAPGGGDKIANVRHDADYAVDGRRSRVTRTDEGVPLNGTSGGGGGGGGGTHVPGTDDLLRDSGVGDQIDKAKDDLTDRAKSMFD